jgi:tRNA threonylcarbamoyladenosine biosynthesis protein TsaB
MNILALESSTMLGSAAVICDGKVLSEISSLRQRSHSEILNLFVDECLTKAHLKLQDIDVFAAGQGPGSFTGIRVAANIIKTFSYSFNKPLVSIDSLANIAWQYGALDRPLMPMINAYKNMVYTAIYKFTAEGPEEILKPCAIPVRELKNYLKIPVYAVGDGWLDYHEYFSPELTALIERPAKIFEYPTATALGLCSEKIVRQGKAFEWNSFAPLYIRASEAEECKNGIFISPLN